MTTSHSEVKTTKRSRKPRLSGLTRCRKLGFRVVKELKLNYYKKEPIFFTIARYSSNLM